MAPHAWGGGIVHTFKCKTPVKSLVYCDFSKYEIEGD